MKYSIIFFTTSAIKLENFNKYFFYIILWYMSSPKNTKAIKNAKISSVNLVIKLTK